MKTLNKYWLGLAASASLTPSVWAQVPAQLPGLAGAGGAAAPQALQAAPASPTTLWSFLGLSSADKAACLQSLCNSPLGQLLGNGMQPISMFSGGIVPSFCPDTPTAADLAKEGSEGTAAAIKKDEAGAKARRAAVRYLGTVDCHYWPEAGEALINSLRADKNECVRWEAAMALARGCCCTKETVKALSICVAGTKEDHNPEEVSPRVKMAACAALEMCLDRVPPEKPKPAEPRGGEPGSAPLRPQPSGEKGSGATAKQSILPEFYQRLRMQSSESIFEEARKVVQNAHATQVSNAPVPSGQRSVFGILAHALHGGTAQEPETMQDLRARESRGIFAQAPTAQQPVIVVRNPEPTVVTPDAAPKYGLMEVLHGTRPNVVYADKEIPVKHVQVADTTNDKLKATTPPTLMSIEPQPASLTKSTAASPGSTSTSMKPAILPDSLGTSSKVPNNSSASSPVLPKPQTTTENSNSVKLIDPPMLRISTPATSDSVKSIDPPMLRISTPATSDSAKSIDPPMLRISTPATSGADRSATPAYSGQWSTSYREPTVDKPVAGAVIHPSQLTSATVPTAPRQVSIYAPAAPTQVAAVTGPDVGALARTLRSDRLDAHREDAAINLGTCDCRSHPEAVSALAKAAGGDASAQVRYASIRVLMAMKADTPEVREAFDRARKDGLLWP